MCVYESYGRSYTICMWCGLTYNLFCFFFHHVFFFLVRDSIKFKVRAARYRFDFSSRAVRRRNIITSIFVSSTSRTFKGRCRSSGRLVISLSTGAEIWEPISEQSVFFSLRPLFAAQYFFSFLQFIPMNHRLEFKTLSENLAISCSVV